MGQVEVSDVLVALSRSSLGFGFEDLRITTVHGMDSWILCVD